MEALPMVIVPRYAPDIIEAQRLAMLVEARIF
jgi:hypothetical protein